jgi:CHAD domain-containing protein
MAYELSPEEPVGTSLKRCAREQLEKAIKELRDGVHSDPVGSVHSARKAIKKERALLRLARHGLKPARRRADNRTLRDAARSLSGLRDAQVMLQALDKLAERSSGQLPDTVFAGVRKQLERGRASAQERAAQSETVAEAIQALDGVLQQVDGWKFTRKGRSAIAGGLELTYQQGRAARRRAAREPTVENLHEWRKRVKDLWYDARLLSPVCGPLMYGCAEEAEQLSELLGDDHDLGVLKQTISEINPGVGDDLAPLAELIDHRRAELQSQAMLLGRRLYAERPRSFVRRTQRYWKAGRKQATPALQTQAQPISSRRPNTRSNTSSSP